MITISTLHIDDTTAVAHVASLLHLGFVGISPAWPDLASAHSEVLAHSTSSHISLIATIDHTIVGWVAANPQYDGHAWELHPLVVAQAYRRRGIARTLVAHLITQLQYRAATTLFVWCDDEIGNTSLAHTTLYPEPLLHTAQFQATTPHASLFYRSVGFALCGVLPDANGIGKPDILFARRVNAP